MFFMSRLRCARDLPAYLEEDDQPMRTPCVLNPQPLPHLSAELPPPAAGGQAWEPCRPLLQKGGLAPVKNESSCDNVRVE